MATALLCLALLCFVSLVVLLVMWDRPRKPSTIQRPRVPVDRWPPL